MKSVGIRSIFGIKYSKISTWNSKFAYNKIENLILFGFFLKFSKLDNRKI